MKKAKSSSVISLEQCIEHGLPLKYHCLSCKSDICSDCGLISQKVIRANNIAQRSQHPANREHKASEEHDKPVTIKIDKRKNITKAIIPPVVAKALRVISVTVKKPDKVQQDKDIRVLRGVNSEAGKGDASLVEID